MKNIVVTVMVVCVGLAGLCPAGSDVMEKYRARKGIKEPVVQNKGRLLHFPTDRSVGKISLQDADFQKVTATFFCWIPDMEKWDCYCAAKGDVRIPAGKRVKLSTNWNRKPDPDDLSRLRPDDLHSLVVTSGMDKSLRADDLYMDAVGRLTGLKVLDIRYSNITSQGLFKISKLTELEELSLGEGITNSGMRVAASLKSLKGLHFAGCSITDASLAKICENLSLEELSLFGEKLSDEGLAHLSKMGTLKYLRIAGDNFTDAGMAHLKDVSSLRILHAGSLMMITDEGIKHLSEHPLLERINFHWNRNITNESARYLGRMRSLKMLDVIHSQIDDVGVGYLSKCKTLEYPMLPRNAITNAGLEDIGELSNLKMLWVGTRSGSVLDDDSLSYIAKLKNLQELVLAGQGVTDAGMEHLVKLKKLKLLSLANCPVTNKGFEKVSALKSLEELSVRDLKITVSGLKCLNELTNLKRLTLNVIQDHSVMGLSGLKNLEELTISTPHKSEDLLTDADLAWLAKLKNLKWFTMHRGAISGQGLKHLAGLTNIEWLSINGFNLKDEDFRYFSNMKKLSRLSVSGSNLNDACLKHLEVLPLLSELNFSRENDITDEALKRLQAKLPNLSMIRVYRDKNSQRNK